MIDGLNHTIVFQNTTNEVSQLSQPTSTALETGLTDSIESDLGISRKQNSTFRNEHIPAYPSLAQMASSIKVREVDIAIIGAAAFHKACKESGRQPVLLRASAFYTDDSFLEDVTKWPIFLFFYHFFYHLFYLLLDYLR